MNGVGVMRKGSGRGRGVKNREERIGVVVVCVELGQELEVAERIGLKATVEPRVTYPERRLFGEAAEARSN